MDMPTEVMVGVTTDHYYDKVLCVLDFIKKFNPRLNRVSDALDEIGRYTRRNGMTFSAHCSNEDYRIHWRLTWPNGKREGFITPY